VLSTELRDNSNLQLRDGRVSVDINDSPNSIPLLKIYSISRGFSMLLQTLRRRCPRVRLRVLESYTTAFARNDILITFFCTIFQLVATDYYLIDRNTIFCCAFSSCKFFFFIFLFWNESRSVCRAPNIRRRLGMYNAAARSCIFSKRFRNQCFENVGYARGMHARNTFVSSRLN